MCRRSGSGQRITVTEHALVRSRSHRGPASAAHALTNAHLAASPCTRPMHKPQACDTRVRHFITSAETRHARLTRAAHMPVSQCTVACACEGLTMVCEDPECGEGDADWRAVGARVRAHVQDPHPLVLPGPHGTYAGLQCKGQEPLHTPRQKQRSSRTPSHSLHCGHTHTVTQASYCCPVQRCTLAT